MMKRIVQIVALLIVLVVSIPAAAHSDLTLFGAWFTPTDLDSSFGGGLKGDFYFGGSSWALEARGTYFSEMGRNLGDFIEGENQRILKIQMVPLDLGLNYHFFDNRNLFVGGGITYVVMDSNILQIDDEVGWYLTGGFITGGPGKGVAFYLDGMYRVLTGTVEGGDYQPFDVDVDGFGFNAGISIRF